MENSELCDYESQWLLLNNLTPFDTKLDSGAGFCFLTKIENDIQRVFDHLQNKFSIKDNYVSSKILLKKGNIFQKGDFFLSLRSNRIFFIPSVKEELLDKLKSITYVIESSVDEFGNLLLCLNRTVLFKEILSDVMKYGENYGIKTYSASYLVLVHNEVFNNFDTLRIALVANQVISFLTATGAAVSVNDFKKHQDLVFKEISVHECSDSCLQEIRLTQELIENSIRNFEANQNKWISLNDAENITICVKKFSKFCSVSHEKDVEDIILLENKPNPVTLQSAYTLHFKSFHAAYPDRIVHICLQNDKRKLIESGLLIEILEFLDIPQSFISCQNTQSKSDPEVTVDEYISYHRNKIENAVKDKYNHDELKSEKGDIYLNKLLDTSLKFSFLRTGINDPLKIDLTLDQKSFTKNKDGIFIQYNFARVSNILKSFEFKVKEGYYDKLPILDEIDFSFLKFEEEWHLLNFILCFPRLVQEILFSLNSKSFFPVNKVLIMLVELCHCFSKYYSRIRILGGPQPQLQKVMQARLWLLKGIHQIMYNSFKLMDIEGLKEM